MIELHGIPGHQKSFFYLVPNLVGLSHQLPPFITHAERLGAYSVHLERNQKSLVPQFLVLSPRDVFGLILPLWVLRHHDRPAKAGLWAEDLPLRIDPHEANDLCGEAVMPVDGSFGVPVAVPLTLQSFADESLPLRHRSDPRPVRTCGPVDRGKGDKYHRSTETCR